ncbi:MAG TPA: hypothetical protein VKP30_19205, partial [Polyangiaceae bacterium]|nr:hypothetical protein [Polyangiaceae bacterium]
EAHLDALVNTLEAVGAPILDLLSRVRVLDARLPGTVALRDPGDQEVTLVPISINGGTLEERYQRLADANRRQSSIRNHQQMALQFARGKLGTFLARIDAMGKQWSDTDKKGELLRQTLDLMLRQVRDSTSGAELLNQSSSARANVTEQLRNARSYSREWLRSATAAPAGSAGAFEQLERVFSEFESTWVPLNVALPDPSWSDFKTRIQDLRVVFARYESAVSNPNADKWGEAYLKALRDFGRVDHATARHIRCMVTLGELGGRKVFLTPRDGEYLLLSDTVDNVLPRVMDNALQGMRRAAGDGPLPIIRFIYHHESGANHVRGFAGSNYVTLGIDWPNGKTSNAFFDEAETPAKVLSTSRGWGATQFTLFHTGRHGLLKDETGASVKFTIVDGIPFSTASSTKRPLPLCIQSAEENLVEGTKLFLDGFRPPPHRECSYQQGGAPSSGHSYACAACAKRLRTGPYRVIGGGVHTFDDAQGDFERIPKLGGPTYKLRSLARLRELLDSGYFALPDGRTSAQVTDADLIEFPCSWLSCVARYAGTTRRGFDYMLEAIETLSRT